MIGWCSSPYVNTIELLEPKTEENPTPAIRLLTYTTLLQAVRLFPSPLIIFYQKKGKKRVLNLLLLLLILLCSFFPLKNKNNRGTLR